MKILPTSAIPKHPRVMIRKELYISSLMIKSFPKSPEVISQIANKVITVKERKPTIDFSFISFLSLKISLKLIVGIVFLINREFRVLD